MASALLTIEGAVVALRSDHAAAISAQEQALRIDAIAAAIQDEIGRIRRITTASPAGDTSCRLARVIDRLVALQRARGVIVDVILDGDPQVAMPGDDLARTISNLLDNCARYAPGAPITISGFVVGDRFELHVGDEGPGMSREVLGRAFDRGVSSRRNGGLGLFSVRELVRASGGSVRAESSERGTIISIDLPLAAGQSQSAVSTPGALGSAAARPAPVQPLVATPATQLASVEPARSTASSQSAPSGVSMKKEVAA